MFDRWVAFFGTDRAFGLAGVTDMTVYAFSLVIVFYVFKERSLKYLLIAVAHIAVLYCSLLLLTSFLSAATSVDVLINYLPKAAVTCLYAIFFSDCKPQARVILATTLFAINHCLIEAGGALSGILNAPARSAIEEYLRNGITAATVPFAVVLRVFNVDRNRYIPWSAAFIAAAYNSMAVVLAILRSIFASYYGDFQQTENYVYSIYPNAYAIATLMFFAAFNMICYFLVDMNCKNIEKNLQLSKESASRESVRSLTEISEENLRQMRLIKHEIKKRYAVMQLMLEEKQYDRLEKYFAEMSREAIVPLSQVNTGNPSFDMVVNLEITKAVAKGIEVDTKLIVPPQMQISDTDLSGLIANLMDNAIEACEKITDGTGRIELKSYTVHDYFVLKIANTVSAERLEEALSLRTDKQDKTSHGFGSKIVDAIVNKYGGQINRNISGNTFVVDVMLDLLGTGGGYDD